MLLTEPLFCHLIDEKAAKYMFVVAYTTTSTQGYTLLQRIESHQEEKILPPCLTLNGKVHRYINDRQLNYKSCRLLTGLPIKKFKISELSTIPPKVKEPDK
jgi:hypothetical protein